MIKRYEVTGAGGSRLAAWEYAAWEYAACGYAAGPSPGRAAAASLGVLPPGGPAAAPAVVLLHGLLGRASHWAATARGLAPAYRTIALDQRGHGRSARPPGPYTPDAYAADAIAAIEQLELGSAVVVGHSMGALTAWQCAVQRPDLTAGVVLCDMRAAALGEAGQRELADWLAAWPVPFANLADARHWFAAEDPWADPTHPATRAEFLAETLCERDDGWYPMHDAQHLLASRDAWIRDAHWDELARVTCPALVVRGVNGELGRAEAQEMVRVLPRGHYAEIADAGHLVPWDQPEAFCSVVRGFAETAFRERAASLGN